MAANPQVYIDSLLIYLRESLAECHEVVDSPAMNAWRAATLDEAAWLENLDQLSAEDILANCPKPALSYTCENCGGDVRHGQHDVRIAVDAYTCIASRRQRWLDRADEVR